MKTSTFALLLVACSLAVLLSNARATIIVEGTEAEKQEINQAIEEIQKDSPTAKAIIDDLKKAEAGDVTIKFGDTADIATAVEGPPKVITLDKEAIGKMKQVGAGKALEQFGVPYLIIHEGWHILHGADTEDQTVSQINKAREERKSSKRTKYEPEEEDGKLYLPFDDGSKVDVTEALKTGSDGKKAVDVWQSASVALTGTSTPAGVAMSLSGGAVQPMQLQLPSGFGSDVTVDLLQLSAVLEPSASDDFSLSISSFVMEFSSFEFNGQQTGLNQITFYLDHQTPYGDWTYTDALEPFEFDFSGDLGWTNSLFGDHLAMAYERLTGTMNPSVEGWTGVCNLTGVKFAPIPEPGTLWILALAGVLTGIAQRR